jgi:hypothetical protein
MSVILSDEDVPMTKCFQEREEAMTSVSKGDVKNVFIPECNADGTFAEVQCHSASGFCWCVESDGKPYPRTSTKDDRPNCKGNLLSTLGSWVRALLLIKIMFCHMKPVMVPGIRLENDLYELHEVISQSLLNKHLFKKLMVGYFILFFLLNQASVDFI